MFKPPVEQIIGLLYLVISSISGQSLLLQLAIFKKSQLSFTAFFTDFSSKGVITSFVYFFI